MNKKVNMRNENIASKIDKYLTRLALYRLKDILVNESNKGYYRNYINIKDNIEIECVKNITSDGCEYDSIKSIVFWSNGFYGVNTVNKFKSLSKNKK